MDEARVALLLGVELGQGEDAVVVLHVAEVGGAAQHIDGKEGGVLGELLEGVGEIVGLHDHAVILKEEELHLVHEVQGALVIEDELVLPVGHAGEAHTRGTRHGVGHDGGLLVVETANILSVDAAVTVEVAVVVGGVGDEGVQGPAPRLDQIVQLVGGVGLGPKGLAVEHGVHTRGIGQSQLAHGQVLPSLHRDLLGVGLIPPGLIVIQVLELVQIVEVARQHRGGGLAHVVGNEIVLGGTRGDGLGQQIVDIRAAVAGIGALDDLQLDAQTVLHQGVALKDRGGDHVGVVLLGDELPLGVVVTRAGEENEGGVPEVQIIGEIVTGVQTVVGGILGLRLGGGGGIGGSSVGLRGIGAGGEADRGGKEDTGEKEGQKAAEWTAHNWGLPSVVFDDPLYHKMGKMSTAVPLFGGLGLDKRQDMGYTMK